MPRRTGVDTLFDNQNVPDAEELRALSDMETMNAYRETAILRPLDGEDENQIEEGLPGEFGSFGEEDADDPEGMDDEDYENAVSAGISAAEDFIDMELSPDRELAARYYRGEPFGNEVDGRSAVIMTEVRDTVLAVMPALLRIFCGTTNAVEFINSIATPQEQADAQTAYCNTIIHKDNDGFTLFYSAFKDALVRKTGIFTWWHEEKETVTSEVQTGLNEAAYALLQIEKEESSSEDEYIKYRIEVIDERVDTTAATETPALLGEEDPSMTPLAPPAQQFIRDVRVTKVTIKKRHKVAAVPPEEFICSPTSSDDIDTFPLVGRRQMKTIGDLVALGHDEDEIREAIEGGGNGGSSLMNNAEVIDRNGASVERLFDTGFEDVDPASEMVKYCVIYILIDKDGDGILERRKVCTVGDNHKIIYDEIVDEMVPFALICPDPEPHSPFGYSLADQTMDMQEIKSEMIRGVLDSLAESIVGRTAIVEGQVNIDDALSNERDQLIRIKSQGAIQSLSKPFVGMNAMPVFEYLDNVKARRTGITMAPAGLAADTLQSTSTDAVNAVVDASQERVEMIARIFAETGVKRLMRGLLQNVVRHQDQKRMIRLRGKPVTVDPRSFVADLDLEANVGLGRGTAAKKLQGLGMIIAKQQEVYEKFGADNPFVPLHKISNSIEDWVHEIGFNDANRYFDLPDQTAAAEFLKRQAQKPQPPTPEEILQATQREKNASNEKIAQIKAMVDLMKAQAKNKTDEEKLDQDFYLQAAEIMGKFGIELSQQEIDNARAEDEAADNMAREAQQGAQAALAPPTGSTP